MFVIVLATLCLNGVCDKRIVTDQATQMECRGPFAQQALAKWMSDQGLTEQGYTLKGYECINNPVKRVQS